MILRSKVFNSSCPPLSCCMNLLEKHLDHYPDVEILYYCREVSSISSRYPSYTTSC